MSLFHWCEQSECADKCTCLSTNLCKQICAKDECTMLNCSTTQPCFQRVLFLDWTAVYDTHTTWNTEQNQLAIKVSADN